MQWETGFLVVRSNLKIRPHIRFFVLNNEISWLIIFFCSLNLTFNVISLLFPSLIQVKLQVLVKFRLGPTMIKEGKELLFWECWLANCFRRVQVVSLPGRRTLLTTNFLRSLSLGIDTVGSSGSEDASGLKLDQSWSNCMIPWGECIPSILLTIPGCSDWD